MRLSCSWMCFGTSPFILGGPNTRWHEELLGFYGFYGLVMNLKDLPSYSFALTLLVDSFLFAHFVDKLCRNRDAYGRTTRNPISHSSARLSVFTMPTSADLASFIEYQRFAVVLWWFLSCFKNHVLKDISSNEKKNNKLTHYITSKSFWVTLVKSVFVSYFH